MLVVGEPGIGKTVLVADAVDTMAARGIQVAWGRAIEGSGAPAFWPWTQVLRAAGSLAADEHVGDDESGDDQFRLFDRVLRRLDEHSRTDGLLVVLDDLQWADADSMRLLEFVARQLSGRRLAIVGTYRDTEAGDTAPPSRCHGRGHPPRGAAHGGRRRHDVRATGADVDLDGAARLRERTGGNPLFVHELTRLAQTRAAIREMWPASSTRCAVSSSGESRGSPNHAPTSWRWLPSMVRRSAAAYWVPSSVR